YARDIGLTIKIFDWKKNCNRSAGLDSRWQEVIIGEDGKTAFKFMDQAAVKTAREIGGMNE
ncbi:MAG: hypothetical protein QME78_12635, partial [Thermodesulfobacteriota bacterium]|nr:hypothetical protein [Thermodesulfobacteriota bacterium]